MREFLCDNQGVIGWTVEWLGILWLKVKQKGVWEFGIWSCKFSHFWGNHCGHSHQSNNLMERLETSFVLYYILMQCIACFGISYILFKYKHVWTVNPLILQFTHPIVYLLLPITSHALSHLQPKHTLHFEYNVRRKHPNAYCISYITFEYNTKWM